MMQATIDIDGNTALITEWTDDGNSAEDGKKTEAEVSDDMLNIIAAWIEAVKHG